MTGSQRGRTSGALWRAGRPGRQRDGRSAQGRGGLLASKGGPATRLPDPAGLAIPAASMG